MRVVIDTNVIVSGYLGGALEAIIVAWKSGKFTLIVSDAIANKYHTILNDPNSKLNAQNRMIFPRFSSTK
jgi:predicted nucleic acid-binding protein